MSLLLYGQYDQLPAEDLVCGLFTKGKLIHAFLSKTRIFLHSDKKFLNLMHFDELLSSTMVANLHRTFCD